VSEFNETALAGRELSIPGIAPSSAHPSLRCWARAAARGPAILFMAFCVNSLAVFGFHVIVSRILGPDRYGALGAILALTLVFNVIAGGVSAAVVRQVAIAPPATAWDLRHPSRMIGVVCIVITAFGVGFAPVVTTYLHLASAIPALLLTAFCLAVVAGVVAKGLLVGQRRFAEMAVAVLVTAVVRILSGAPLASTRGLSGALGAYVLAEATGTATAIWFVRRRHRTGAHRLALRLPVGAVGLSLAAYAGIWMLSGTDQFLARHLLPGVDAGTYVAASTAASIALWIPYNATASLYPRLAAESTSPTAGGRAFVQGLSIVGGLAGAAAALLAGAAPAVVMVLFGRPYQQAAPVLAVLAFANGAQGIANFLLHHQLASHRRTVLLPWIGFIALVVGIHTRHNSTASIAWVTLAVSLTLLLAMLACSVHLARTVQLGHPDRPVEGLPCGS